jgi:hypothetical protein
VKRKKKGIKVNLGCLMTKQLREKRQILLPINSEAISQKKKRGQKQRKRKAKETPFHILSP